VQIANKVIVVTGGGSGIGSAMARRFSAEGARAVVIADLDFASAQAAAHLCGGMAVRTDVGDAASLQDLIETVEAKIGPIDLFCSNAGITVLGGAEAPDTSWERVWRINVMAHVVAARLLVPRMLSRGGGYLLNTASAAGLLSSFDAPYAVSKHGAVAFAEWLSITYGGNGLGVSCLCPAGVDTPMLRSEPPERRALLSDGLMSADAVAEVVARDLAIDRFLILPNPKVLEWLQRKTSDPERWIKGMRKHHASAIRPYSADRVE
jgi:NAD(P)-dependent dehydrogenase (short-subunit alcohol dehydrogenase family)